MVPVIAIVAGLGAAVVFGMSSVAEQRSTKRVQTRRALSPWILLDLVRQPLWVIAIGGTVIGFALQVLALKYGPLALVEPLLVCDLLFAALITSYLRRRIDPVILGGVVATAAGVAGFLAIGRPSTGQSTVSFFVVLPLAAALAACVAGCLAVARRNRNLRPLALALACGICYGTAAFLVKLVVSDLSGGLPHLLTDWPIYALAVVGPVGFVLNQDAFQQGTLLAPVLAIITACDPVISIALAYLWLNERLSSSPGAIAGQVISLVIMITGIVVLANQSPMAVQKRTEAVTQAARSRQRLYPASPEAGPEAMASPGTWVSCSLAFGAGDRPPVTCGNCRCGTHRQARDG